MKSNHTDGRGLQRRRLLIELIQQRLKEKTEADSVVFELSELKKYPLLNDLDALERALVKIKEDLKPDFDFMFIKRSSVSSAADVDMRSPTFVVKGLRVSVDDASKLNTYLSQDQRIDKFYFDPIKSRLYLRGIEFKIQKFKEQYHTLRVIFEQPDEVGKEWFFSEIAEKLDVHKPNEKTYYNAIHQVRLKLAAEGFRDVFTTTKQSVKINPKYLS